MSPRLSATYRIQPQNPLLILNQLPKKAGAGNPYALHPERKRARETVYPSGMVLDACPDILDYSRGGISNWRDLLAAASVVRSALGVSPSAWQEAQTILGEKSAAIVIAAILQRGNAITSAGGYLRELTRKAQANTFSIGPMLMALISARQKKACVGERAVAACQILRPSVSYQFRQAFANRCRPAAGRRGGIRSGEVRRIGRRLAGRLRHRDALEDLADKKVGLDRRQSFGNRGRVDAQPEHCPRVAWNVSLDHDLSDHTPVLGAVGGRNGIAFLA